MADRVHHLAVYLTKDELVNLDYARKVLGLTRARVVREAVLEAIECAVESAREMEDASA